MADANNAESGGSQSPARSTGARRAGSPSLEDISKQAGQPDQPVRSVGRAQSAGHTRISKEECGASGSAPKYYLHARKGAIPKTRYYSCELESGSDRTDKTVYRERRKGSQESLSLGSKRTFHASSILLSSSGVSSSSAHNLRRPDATDPASRDHQ
jgi:hypothetical protein